MGLCKCRTVTTLFCFEHRKNVCEKCVISDHVGCVVKSYLQWLQDSEFDPSCQLCHKLLRSEDASETLRLSCFDVFHLSCFLHYCESTYGDEKDIFQFKCPSCTGPVLSFESTNRPDGIADSPLVSQILTAFTKAPWANKLDLERLKKGKESSASTITTSQEKMVAIEIGPRAGFMDGTTASMYYNGKEKSLPPGVLSQHSPFRTRQRTLTGTNIMAEPVSIFHKLFRVGLNCLTLRNVRILSRGISPRHLVLVVVMVASIVWTVGLVYYFGHSWAVQ